MLGAATIATAVPTSEKGIYKEYLKDMGFANFELFHSKAQPELLMVLFTDKLEAIRYRTNNVEEHYLVTRIAYDDTDSFENDFTEIYREWE